MITTIRSSKPLLSSFFSASSLQRSSSFSSPNFISFPSINNNNNNHYSNHKRMLASTMSHASSLHPQLVQGQVGDSFLRNVLSSMEHVYLNRNPTAKAMLDLTTDHDNQSICYDHLAFRTFGVDGHGIESMSKLFLDFGYTQMEELTFPKKKLRALWFSPPPIPNGVGGGSGVHGPLPRIFISELLVHQMSRQAQEIIHKYVGLSGATAGHERSALASALGCLTWPKPSHSEFQQLARESEYAAWTLVNGYTLNHVTISIHRLKPPLNDINNFNQFVEDNGFKLNSEGGVLKVSPDGLLLQSSTVADSIPFQFSDGFTESVPCSYIEFAQRLVLPQYKHLPQHEVEEVHRRDGFEVGNADKIFESTSKDQLTRKA
ncbi:hypothetical protein CTI12_AA081290 [Artemisia annua]|uniref:2-oxoadipate dioxygenase/decarboxylase n=1 Tax=Artemisia annua TaxID=35608 RepID=A0A2U1Q2S4_ARTAN|nr:hypothetical protein CTI12_AA081290 [Artemisia annua]